MRQPRLAGADERKATAARPGNAALRPRISEFTEAQEQLAATSEILRVISRSPADVQPVFDTIAAAALKLCRADTAIVLTLDGELLRVASLANVTAEGADAIGRVFPRRPGTETAAGRAVLTHRVVVIPDVFEDPEYGVARLVGTFRRSLVAVPLERDGRVSGAIAVGRPEPGPFPDTQIALLQTFADQAAIAIENARLLQELQSKNRALTDALDQQTATSEILRVISRSPSDVQPVFDTIVTNSARLCEANFAFAMLHEDGRLSLAARTACTLEFAGYLARGFEINRETTTGRAALERKPVQVNDFPLEAGMRVTPAHLSEGIHTVLAVPMLRDIRLLGVVTIWRHEIRPFTDKQIALLQTFADQAVIAIENVRLFQELQAKNHELIETLEQKSATSEILRVISRSPTDVQPVFDTIAASALRLCSAKSANVFTYDGELLRIAALAIVDPKGLDAMHGIFPRPASRDSGACRAVLTRSVVAIPDVLGDPDFVTRDAAVAADFRSVLAVPLMRDGEPIGAIAVGRPEPGPIPEQQVALLQTFADQAVIAIENVRLFTELQVRNRDLTEALDQQTATSDILRVISRLPADPQPVFDTIAEAALKLCNARSANVFTFDGALLHAAAIRVVSPDGAEAVRRLYPRPPDRATAASRAVLLRGLVAIHDVLADPDYVFPSGANWGFRSVLGVPLLREGTPIGAIAVGRTESGPFPDTQVALLQTFADQAVIAIENVRLFNELDARTKQLTQSVQQLRALAEVGQAVSSTLDLETVLSTIVSRATQLAGMDGGAIWEYDESRGEFRLHAAERLPGELVQALRISPVSKGEGAIGRLALTAEPVTIPDIMNGGMYQSKVREILVRRGFRSLLAVPLLRENRLLGGLVVHRKQAGEFEPQVIDLLKTFATQSALAIQNARLFREIEDKSRQLESASRHKSAFLANMSHELRTPLNAIIGFTRIVMRRSQEQLEPKQFENLEKILASGQNLLSLINAILDLAKVEAGRIEINPSDVQLAPLLEHCTRTVEPLIRDTVTLVKDFGAELPRLVVDEEKLRQIVINLLSNAAKFTAHGSIEIRACDVDGGIEIAVVDTGIGIAPEKLDLIFEEFEQADTSSTRAYGGTGLGLAIARRLARLMGGEIRAASKLGAGSTFTLTLPALYGTSSA